MVVEQVVMPYRVHSKDEMAYFNRFFNQQHNRTIWDIERFWSQTTEAAEDVAKKIVEAGFLLSTKVHDIESYRGSVYHTGLYSLIFPCGTHNELLQKPLTNSPEYTKSNLGKLVYWEDGGFNDEPIIVQYDLDIDSSQNFDEVARLERFLRKNNLPFQVTPNLDEIQELILKSKRAIQRAELYQTERNKTF